MALLNTSASNKRLALSLSKGFTLVEILIAMGIMGMLVSVSMFLGVDSYKRYIFRSEESKLIDILQKQRSRAVNNYYQMPHGLCLESSSKNYILFRGTYDPADPTNEVVSGNNSLTLTGMPVCGVGSIIFTQLSGATTGVSIDVADGIRTANIGINDQGAIQW